MLPHDPIMLLGAVNMLLRDRYATLDALCEDMDEDRARIEAALAEVGYAYDAAQNRFL